MIGAHIAMILRTTLELIHFGFHCAAILLCVAEATFADRSTNKNQTQILKNITLHKLPVGMEA